MMLMRTDPFRELDRFAQQIWGTPVRPAAMPIDAYRQGDHFIAEFDLPGVDEESIDLTVEKNVLTVHAERSRVEEQDGDLTEVIISERPYGTFNRQLFLGESLNTDQIDASYVNGVLTVRIPIAETAKARKVQINAATKKKSAALSA